MYGPRSTITIQLKYHSQQLFCKPPYYKDTMSDHFDIGYDAIQILKNETLGIGSYGSVCKAKCDDLVCAAKILHPTLFDPNLLFQAETNQQHRLPFRRFQQECEYLSALKHPNVVQYLGTFQDPETRLPVLLMELLDDSLTHFLETIDNPLPYHIQLNFCHDITMALSFLHRNSITHRDLSSNNILLIGNVRAKVTDFGMAKICNANGRTCTTQFSRSFTMCPGTEVYMPPEAIGDKPVYTEKIDCFSFGVLVVQILVRKFPNPGNRLKSIEIEHPQFPIVEVRVSEVERRQSHIDEIQPDHALLPIALDCLKDRENERPSAHELCQRLLSLKQTIMYAESRRVEPRPIEPNSEDFTDGGENKESKQQDENKTRKIRQMEKALREKENYIAELEAREEKKSEDTTTKILSMKWKRAKSAPHKMVKGPNAVSDSSMMYLRPGGKDVVYAYNPTSDIWHELPSCGDIMCSIAIVNDLLTIIGGENDDKTPSNKVMSLTKNSRTGKWIALFPSMPTPRCAPTTVCKEEVLIVAGGIIEKHQACSKIEVMNTKTLVWSRVMDAPYSLFWGSIKLCGDRAYLLGGWNNNREQVTDAFTCSLSDLLETYPTPSIASQIMKVIKGQDQISKWKRVADMPVQRSTCVEVNSRLMLIGGKDSTNKPTPAIYMYNIVTNKWQIAGNKLTAQCWCIASDFSNNMIVTIGGYNGKVGRGITIEHMISNSSCDVEIAIFDC